MSSNRLACERSCATTSLSVCQRSKVCPQPGPGKSANDCVTMSSRISAGACVAGWLAVQCHQWATVWMTLVIQISNSARHSSAAVNSAASAPRRCSMAPNPRGVRKCSHPQATTRGDAENCIQPRRPQEGAVAVGDHHEHGIEDHGESELVTKRLRHEFQFFTPRPRLTRLAHCVSLYLGRACVRGFTSPVEDLAVERIGATTIPVAKSNHISNEFRDGCL